MPLALPIWRLHAKPLTKIKKQCQTNIPSFGMLGQLNPKQKDVLIQFIWKKIFKQSDINIIMKEYAKIKDKKQITPIEKESIELINYILEKL